MLFLPVITAKGQKAKRLLGPLAGDGTGRDGALPSPSGRFVGRVGDEITNIYEIPKTDYRATKKWSGDTSVTREISPRQEAAGTERTSSFSFVKRLP